MISSMILMLGSIIQYGPTLVTMGLSALAIYDYIFVVYLSYIR